MVLLLPALLWRALETKKTARSIYDNDEIATVIPSAMGAYVYQRIETWNISVKSEGTLNVAFNFRTEKEVERGSNAILFLAGRGLAQMKRPYIDVEQIMRRVSIVVLY